MAHAVSRRPLMAENRVRSQVRHMGFAVYKVALGRVLRSVRRFSPVIPPVLEVHSVIHSSITDAIQFR